MNTGLLFLLLSMVFSALWIIENERRRRLQAEYDKLKEALEFAEFRARTATGMYINEVKKQYFAAPSHVSEE